MGQRRQWAVSLRLAHPQHSSVFGERLSQRNKVGSGRAGHWLFSSGLCICVDNYIHIHDTYTQHMYSYVQENIIKRKMVCSFVRKLRDAPCKNEVTSALVLDTSASRNNLFTWLKDKFFTHAMRHPVHEKKANVWKQWEPHRQESVSTTDIIFLLLNMYNAQYLKCIDASACTRLYCIYGLLFGWSLRQKSKFVQWYSVEHKILGEVT